jgi:hypothetical protein
MLSSIENLARNPILNLIFQEKINEPKDSQCNPIRKLRADGRAGYGVASASPGRPRTYLSIAPLEQYLMERNAEIAMARSAAPESGPSARTGSLITPKRISPKVRNVTTSFSIALATIRHQHAGGF